MVWPAGHWKALLFPGTAFAKFTVILKRVMAKIRSVDLIYIEYCSLGLGVEKGGARVLSCQDVPVSQFSS